jgi:hypothetical protein
MLPDTDPLHPHWDDAPLENEVDGWTDEADDTRPPEPEPTE